MATTLAVSNSRARDAERDAFWRRYLSIGFAILSAESVAVMVYFKLTPHGPDRPVLTSAAFLVAVCAVGGLLLVPRVVTKSWRAWYSFGWALVSGAVLTVFCILDGGLDSPLVILLLLPVVNAGAALSPGLVGACGTGAALELFAIVVSDRNITASTGQLATLLATVGGAIVLAVLTASARHRLEIDQQEIRSQLEYMASTDTLTGCLNQGTFHLRLNEEVDRFLRYGTRCSLIIADVDLFKEYNDSSGHEAGDQALARIGNTFRTSARTSDIVARIGGDEFGVILPHSSLAEAEQACARLADAFERESGLAVSVSLGAAEIDPKDPTAIRLFRDADTKLYEFKALRHSHVGELSTSPTHR
ncbi:MAG: GGDEF domain-containing protein [Acidimicrobiales bacterium]